MNIKIKSMFLLIQVNESKYLSQSLTSFGLYLRVILFQ